MLKINSMRNLLALVVLALGLVTVCHANIKHFSLDDLCDNKVDRFTHLYQVFHMNRGPFTENSCLRKISGLERIHYNILSNDAKSVCKEEVGGNYRIMASEMNSLPALHKFPAALKNFMVDVAYEIAAKCKLAIQHSLNTYLNDMLREQDIKLIDSLDGMGALVLNDATVTPSKADLWQVWYELDNILEAGMLKPKDLEEANLPEPTLKMLSTMSAFCTYVYKPINRAFSYTLKELAQLGYDYSLAGQLGEGKNAAFNSDSNLRKWFSMQLTCKALSGKDGFLFKQYACWQDRMIYAKNLMAKYFQTVESIPNQLMIDSKAQKSELRQLSKESSQEAHEIAINVYERVTGSHLNLLNKVGGGNKKFALSLIKLVVEKIGDRVPEVVKVMNP